MSAMVHSESLKCEQSINWLVCKFSTTFLVITLVLGGCQRPNANPEVVLYSSVDETYTLQVAKMFETQTGIEVKLVSDTEATKSTGLLNRLIAEKQHPVADVFWSGDVIRAAVLKRRGVAEPYVPKNSEALPPAFRDPDGYYTGSSGRLRLIIYNTNRIADGQPLPKSVLDLAEPEFAAGSCLASPLFGTTSMHAAALFETLGDSQATKFFEEFRTNGGRMLSSNGEVRRRVGSGEFAFGLTDSDDVSVARVDGKPVSYIIPDQSETGAVLIACAPVLIRGAPHPTDAKKLVDFLVSDVVEKAMAESTAGHFPLRPELSPPAAFGVGLQNLRIMPLDCNKIAARLESLQDGFLRTWAESQP